MLIALGIAVIRDTIKISQMAESKEKKASAEDSNSTKATSAKKSTTAAKKTTTTKKTAAKSTSAKKTTEKKTTAKKTTTSTKKTTAAKKAAPVALETTSVVQEAPVEEKAVDVVENISDDVAQSNTKDAEKAPVKEFDWDAFESDLDTYSKDERKKLNDIYDVTLTQIEEKELIKGFVIAINKKEVVININYKSEGIVPKNEFRYNPDLKIGDEVDLYIESMEDKTGQLVVSHKIARTHRAWQRVNEILVSGEIVTGFVKCRTKGGLIVDVFGLESFLPGSQIDVKPIRDYDQYVGKNMEFKVVKIMGQK